MNALTYLPVIEPNHVGHNTLDRVLGHNRDYKAEPFPEFRVLAIEDSWRKSTRILRWQGPCLSCGRQTWSFDDGENDPRGVLGDAALWSVTVEDHDTEVEVRCCSVCANTYELYQRAMRSAKERGIRTATPYNTGAGVPYQRELIEAWGLVTEDADEYEPPDEDERTYLIKRQYFEDHPSEIIVRGLTLAQAQAHCQDPETSSSTATGEHAVNRTKKMGPWFDGYEEE